MLHQRQGPEEENKNKIRPEILSANGDEKLRCFAVLTILFIFVFCLGIALHHGQINIRMSQQTFDDEILETTMNAINETQQILKLIREQASIIIEQNTQFYENDTSGIPKFNLPTHNTTTIPLDNSSTAINYHVNAITSKVLKETQNILHSIRSQTAAISEANKCSAESYIAGIRDIIREHTAYGVRRISQIILEQIQVIENELTVFDRNITTMVDGNLSVTKKDIENIIENVKKSDASTDMTDLLENSIKNLEKEINNMVSDFDKMFTFYKSYIKDILYQKIEKAGDRIRMYIVSERKFSKCIDLERVSFCCNITHQNTEISNQLKSVVEVINVLTNTTNTVNTFISLFPEDRQQEPLLVECKSMLTEALKFSREMLNTMLKYDGYFLGSVVRNLSYAEHFHTKKHVLRSYETAMKEFMPGISKATKGFKLVQDKFLVHAKEMMFPIIDNLSNEINSKALLVNESNIKENLLERCKFKSIKTMMEENFKNIASTVNHGFDEQLDIMIEWVDMTVQRDSDEMLPYVSTISLKNFLTTDICPLSVDYQIFITSMVRDGMRWKTELDDPQKLDGNFENYEQRNDAEINMIPESIQTKNDVTTTEDTVSAKFDGRSTHLIQSVKDDIAKAGHKVNRPVSTSSKSEK